MTSLNDTFYDCLTQSKYDEFSKNENSKNNNVSNTYNCLTNCFVNLFTFFKDKRENNNNNKNTKIIINSEGNNLEYVAFP